MKTLPNIIKFHTRWYELTHVQLINFVVATLFGDESDAWGGEGVAVEALDNIPVAVPPVNQQVIISKKLFQTTVDMVPWSFDKTSVPN